MQIIKKSGITSGGLQQKISNLVLIFVIITGVVVGGPGIFMVKKLPLTGNRDVYFIFTSGGYAGISGCLAKGIVRKKENELYGAC